MKLIVKMQKSVVIFAMAFLFFVAPFIGQAEASSIAADISKTATSLKGVRYSYGGSTTSGFDCSGYINYVFKENAISVARSSSSLYASGTAVDKANLEVGDLVFFNTTGKGVSHVGIYIGDGEFAHASTSRGVRVDKLNDPHYWGDKYIGAKRVLDSVASAD
ncbi:C40 family peptidase [Sporosarcina sp. YIM B06819]|uniref:C40 family peptidase n=1 Tax=Sporosarcina sp. YIM B06819 TaxID=3081769 RepID=UPI00298C703A|nr:C40 family peptidase [Sporosarcina sp. YIM B06819]